MKIFSFRNQFSAFVIFIAGASGFAQGVGNDNPTGVAGQFSGNSMTACSFSPYTANATRTVVDLTISGAVTPMQWARTYNSRIGGTVANHLGSTGWTHSYLWTASTDETVNTLPASYTVKFPDGRSINFSASTKGDTLYNGPAGTGERFQKVSGSGEVYLFLTDGSKVHFHQQMTRVSVNPSEVFFVLHPVEIIDPQGLITVFTVGANKEITKVQEPGGRWFKLTYDGPNGKITRVDAGYSTNTITQSVTYTYATQSFNGTNFTVLTNANYISDPISTTKATYTYKPSNVGTAWPLLQTCDDPHYPGPMKRIGYSYGTAVYGQIASENYYDGSPISGPTPTPTTVVTLGVNGSTRIETRGDGPYRIWTYGLPAPPWAQPGFTVPKPYLLGAITDFKDNPTYFSYDANSYLNKVKDARGNITSFTRLVLTGKVNVLTNPGDSSTIQFFYSDPATGYYLDRIIDELGHTAFDYTRDGSNRIIRIDYPDTGFETYTYNTFNKGLTHRITAGATYTYTYDPRGLLTDVFDGTNTVHYTYDSRDNVSSVRDGRGNVTTLTHDTRGRLTTLTHPAPSPSSINWAYNTDDTLASVTDELSHTTTYTYDDYKRLRTITTPQRGNGDLTTPTTTITYQPPGLEYRETAARPNATYSPAGKPTHYSHDANWRLIVVREAPGTADDAWTLFGYDQVGNLINKTDPKSNVWTYNYDARNRLTSVDDPIAANRNVDGHTINWTYDAASNVLTTRRTNNQLITNNSFDAMNRVLQQTVQLDPANPTSNPAVSKYTYYPSGLVQTFQDPRLVASYPTSFYTYTYNSVGLLTNLQYPDAGGGPKSEQLTYDAAWNVRTYTNRAGHVLTNTYDERNQLTFQDWSDPATTDVALVYDTASRLTNVNNWYTSITRNYYNDNLLYTESRSGVGDPWRTTTYSYNADGLRSKIVYPSSEVFFFYDYTNRNQLDNIHDNAGAQWVKYIYDLNGNREHRKVNPLSVRDTVYGVADAINRIPSMSTTFTNGTASFSYGFDTVSRLTYEQRNAGTADGYSYDLADQITRFNRDGSLSGGSVTGGALMTLNFDTNGNRTQTSDNGIVSNYVTNALNQYTTDYVSGTVNYDVNGNQNQATGSGWTYTYDAQNRLTNADNNTLNRHVSYLYDGLNRQFSRNENGTVTYSVWDGWSLIQEYAGGNVTHYLNGAGTDELVARFNAGAANRIWYHQDGRGNISHVSNDSGALIERYTYNLGGKPSFWSPTGQAQSSSTVGNRFLYNGRDYSSVTDLYDFRFRFYRHDTSRFLQPDPIGHGGGSNLYRFCGNNPPNSFDPLGMEEAAPPNKLGNGITSPSAEGVVVDGGGIDIASDLYSPGAEYPGTSGLGLDPALHQGRGGVGGGGSRPIGGSPIRLGPPVQSVKEVVVTGAEVPPPPPPFSPSTDQIFRDLSLGPYYHGQAEWKRMLVTSFHDRVGSVSNRLGPGSIAVGNTQLQSLKDKTWQKGVDPSSYAYPLGTRMTVYFDNGQIYSGTVQDWGRGNLFSRSYLGAPNGVAADQWIDIWDTREIAEWATVRIDPWW
ncbi:MAG TPA: RHS repeat-associated core domain-containing protein [Chthoniobacterales bacterium]|nr:RHS repeat-associated core domain-containing protein [Chthoniobacterales bacterium]